MDESVIVIIAVAGGIVLLGCVALFARGAEGNACFQAASATPLYRCPEGSAEERVYQQIKTMSFDTIFCQTNP